MPITECALTTLTTTTPHRDVERALAGIGGHDARAGREVVALPLPRITSMQPPAASAHTTPWLMRLSLQDDAIREPSMLDVVSRNVSPAVKSESRTGELDSGMSAAADTQAHASSAGGRGGVRPRPVRRCAVQRQSPSSCRVRPAAYVQVRSRSLSAERMARGLIPAAPIRSADKALGKASTLADGRTERGRNAGTPERRNAGTPERRNAAHSSTAMPSG
jgi:hypothetical protein